MITPRQHRPSNQKELLLRADRVKTRNLILGTYLHDHGLEDIAHNTLGTTRTLLPNPIEDSSTIPNLRHNLEWIFRSQRDVRITPAMQTFRLAF